MKKTILITGGKGFLGREVACVFKRHGHRIVGIGHGEWNQAEFQACGFDTWNNLHVNLVNLATLEESFDIVIHCAGSGCVQDAQLNPLANYNKTVQSSVELLEYVRFYHPAALFIYPSSAAVYGAKEDRIIKESDPLNPISPYGYHKRMVEEMCDLYAKKYDIKIAIVRMFSIYGPGLRKQLLWDALSKLSVGNKEVLFWGTGNETRDWIHIEDAANLILKISELPLSYIVVNGANGVRITVREIVELLRNELNLTVKLEFNNRVREGDPMFYYADVTCTKKTGWYPKVILLNGLRDYVNWFKTQYD